MQNFGNSPHNYFPGIRQLIKEGAILLDVRTHCEFAGYHIEGAVNVPYDEIERLIDCIKREEKPVITFSAHGRRSEIAARKLRSFGVEVYDGGSVEAVLNATRQVRNDYQLDESN